MVIAETFCHYKICAQLKLTILRNYLSLLFQQRYYSIKTVLFIFIAHFSLIYTLKRLQNVCKENSILRI